MMFPPPPYFGPPRRSGWKTVFTALAVVLLVGSVGLNLLLLVSLLSGDGVTVMQSTLSKGDSTQKIAVVPLKGLIDENASTAFDRYMKQAEEDATVKAVVVEIDSPGGTVTASDEIFHRLSQFKKKKNVPVVISMSSLAASGGYYAACGGDYIFAQPTTLTGSIGVLMPSYNVSKLAQKWGIDENTIVSNGSPYKHAGSPFQAENAEHRKYLQDITDRLYDKFSGIVQAARFNADPAKLKEVANGKIFTADDAKKLGLVDDIGYLEEAWTWAQNKASLKRPMVVRYALPPSLGQLLGLQARETGAHGVSIQIDSKLLNELTTTRPMYLWRADQGATD